MKKTLYILVLFLIGCNNEHELTMERAIQYYEWDMIEESILEFKNVTHALGSQSQKLDYSKIKLLSRAHHNLSVAYAKKEWYVEAVQEAKKAFSLYPSDDNKKILELIQQKADSKNQSTKNQLSQ